MRSAGGLTIIGLCFLAPAASGANSDWEKHVYTSAKGAKLPYRLHRPQPFDAKQRYPLVIYLHGSGSRGNDNERQLGGTVDHFADKQHQKKHPCFVVAPQCSAKSYWAPTVATGIVSAMLSDLATRYPIDKKRIYVTGVSDGGWGVWELLERSPATFAAAVPICGRGDPATAARMVSVPIWVFHGKKDNVEPVKSSREMVGALKRAGGHPRYTEYPDESHNCWDRAYGSSELMTWIFEQKHR